MAPDAYTTLTTRLHTLGSGVPGNLLRAFAFAFEPRTVAKGTLISPSGPPAREVFFVHRGCTRLFYHRDGEEVTAAFAFEGALTGPCKSMMLQTLNRQVFEAYEDCELLTLSRTAFFDVLGKHPELYRIKSVIAERIMFEQEDIIAFFLSHTPEERYTYLLQNMPELFRRVKQQHIASMIGVSPVSLSRIRRRVVERPAVS